MVDFPLRSVDKEVHQLKLTTIITERGGVGGCSRNLCNPHSNLSGMFTGILHLLILICKSHFSYTESYSTTRYTIHTLSLLRKI